MPRHKRSRGSGRRHSQARFRTDWSLPKSSTVYLAESNAQTRQEWIAALDTIESLNPRAVVASHKRPENDDNPRIIEETRQYIRDFDRLAASTTTAQELYEKMLELYPNRVNPGWALWSSARAVKPLNPEVVR